MIFRGVSPAPNHSSVGSAGNPKLQHRCTNVCVRVVFAHPCDKSFLRTLFKVNLLSTCVVLLVEEFRAGFRLHCYCIHFSLHPLPQTALLEESTGEKGISRQISEFQFSQKLLSHPSIFLQQNDRWNPERAIVTDLSIPNGASE